MKFRIFLDFWNFELNWRKKVSASPYDWERIADRIFYYARRGMRDPVSLEETRIYAGLVPQKNDDIRADLEAARAKINGFRVLTVERKTATNPVTCSACKQRFETCPNCKKTLVRAPEKGIDAWIVTDMMSLAWEEAYDVAVLVSTDLDFVEVVKKIQDRGLKVVNATWRNESPALANECWGRFMFEDIVHDIVPQSPPAS